MYISLSSLFKYLANIRNFGFIVRYVFGIFSEPYGCLLSQLVYFINIVVEGLVIYLLLWIQYRGISKQQDGNIKEQELGCAKMIWHSLTCCTLHLSFGIINQLQVFDLNASIILLCTYSLIALSNL